MKQPFSIKEYKKLRAKTIYFHCTMFPLLFPLLFKLNGLWFVHFFFTPHQKAVRWVILSLYPLVKTNNLMHCCLGFLLVKRKLEISPLLLCFFEPKDRILFFSVSLRCKRFLQNLGEVTIGQGGRQI